MGGLVGLFLDKDGNKDISATLSVLVEVKAKLGNNVLPTILADRLQHLQDSKRPPGDPKWLTVSEKRLPLNFWALQ